MLTTTDRVRTQSEGLIKVHEHLCRSLQYPQGHAYTAPVAINYFLRI